MTNTLATGELTKLGPALHYILDAWSSPLGRDSLGGDLQFVVGDAGNNLMGENVILGNAQIKGPKGEPRQEFEALGAQRRDEQLEISVMISVRKRGASALEVFDRVHEIGNRLSAVQRTQPLITLGGLAAGGAALVPLQFEHLLLTPENPALKAGDPKAGPLVRGGRLPCLLVAKRIRF